MYKKIKPIIDFIISFLSLIILFPVILIVIILLFIANDGSPFFVQKRPGKNGKVFKIIKFKTMNDRRDEEGNLLSDAERLTRIGHIIRKTSIDELPQLINVLKGDMSLIGPRPLLVDYLSLYSIEQAKRHNVKPGITGWAQVNGRNAISWDQRFKYDVEYVNKLSLLFDIKILILTFKKVLVREGISSSTAVTMEEFKGK